MKTTEEMRGNITLLIRHEKALSRLIDTYDFIGNLLDNVDNVTVTDEYNKIKDFREDVNYMIVRLQSKDIPTLKRIIYG